MRLIAWTLLLYFTTVSYSKTVKEDESSAIFSHLLQQKCESLPHRSYFSSESMTCYVSVLSSEECNGIRFPYTKQSSKVASGDERTVKRLGIKSNQFPETCAFKIQNDCEFGTSVDAWCYEVVEKKTTFYNAAESCGKKGASLAVVHNDNDLQRLLRATIDVREGLFWIGAGTTSSKWQFHDNSEVDFFRFLPDTKFVKQQVGMVFQSNSKNGSYNGYTMVDKASKKHFFICAKRGNDDYRRPTTTIKFKRPVRKTTTTTTLAPTTTPKPIEPKEWITRNGSKIYRSYKSNGIHYYSLDSYMPPGFYSEGILGYVVTEALYPKIQSRCPQLLKAGVYRRGEITYLGSSPPNGYSQVSAFYCSPRQFYCGANYQLRRLDKLKGSGGDIFYASDENEAYIRLFGKGTDVYTNDWFLEQPCWIWKDKADTNYTVVKARGDMIWSAYNGPNIVYMYSLSRYVQPIDFLPRIPGPGYIVSEDLYDSHFKNICPELIPATVWSGMSRTDNRAVAVFWIGREGVYPPSPMVTRHRKEQSRFYCAPRENYCGANWLLRRVDRTGNIWSGVTFTYPANEAELRTVMASATFKNSHWSEEVCYIWKRWESDIVTLEP